MTETPERDRGFLGLVERLIKKPGQSEAAKPAQRSDPDQVDAINSVGPASIGDVALASLEPQLSVETTRSVDRAKLAHLMLQALQAIEGCPPKGLEIIIYGQRPWNAMLRITPDAGPLPHAKAWRARVQDMVPLLRDQYDLTD